MLVQFGLCNPLVEGQSLWPIATGERWLVADAIPNDGSRNTFFVILHDASGEQHMILKSALVWKGRQDLILSLENFLKCPEKMQRFYTRWGGDNNQKIDFPITKVDIGVARSGKANTSSGTVRFKKIRFLK